jgi:hypothetical protein
VGNRRAFVLNGLLTDGASFEMPLGLKRKPVAEFNQENVLRIDAEERFEIVPEVEPPGDV